MLHLLGFLFLLLITILLIGLSIIGSVLRTLFGGRRRPTEFSGSRNGNFTTHGWDTNTGTQRHSGFANEEEITPEEGELHLRRKKIFSKDEGEYVDFEEL